MPINDLGWGVQITSYEQYAAIMRSFGITDFTCYFHFPMDITYTAPTPLPFHDPEPPSPPPPPEPYVPPTTPTQVTRSVEVLPWTPSQYTYDEVLSNTFYYEPVTIIYASVNKIPENTSPEYLAEQAMYADVPQEFVAVYGRRPYHIPADITGGSGLPEFQTVGDFPTYKVVPTRLEIRDITRAYITDVIAGSFKSVYGDNSELESNHTSAYTFRLIAHDPTYGGINVYVANTTKSSGELSAYLQGNSNYGYSNIANYNYGYFSLDPNATTKFTVGEFLSFMGSMQPSDASYRAHWEWNGTSILYPNFNPDVINDTEVRAQYAQIQSTCGTDGSTSQGFASYDKKIMLSAGTRHDVQNMPNISCDLTSYTTEVNFSLFKEVSMNDTSIAERIYSYPSDVYLAKVEIVKDSNGGNGYKSVEMVKPNYLDNQVFVAGPNPSTGYPVKFNVVMSDCYYPNMSLKFTFIDSSGRVMGMVCDQPLVEVNVDPYAIQWTMKFKVPSMFEPEYPDDLGVDYYTNTQGFLSNLICLGQMLA